MKDELYGAYDRRSAVSKSTDPEKTLSDADRIKTLEKQVKELRELISAFKATSPLWGDIKKGVGLNEKALQISKKINSLFVGYPWIKSIFDAANSVYAAIFGAGASSFAAGGAKKIQQLEIQVGDSTQSQLSAVFGDSDPANNDEVIFVGNNNSVKTQWWSQPETTYLYKDAGGNISTVYIGVKAGVCTLLLTSFTGDSITFSPFTSSGALTLQPVGVPDGSGGSINFYAFQ